MSKQDMAIMPTQKQQITQIQERVSQIQDEVADLMQQTKRMAFNVDMLMREMRELKLMLGNLGNLLQLPPAVSTEERDTDPAPPAEEP